MRFYVKLLWISEDDSLQKASEVRSDLRFEISDFDYLHIQVHTACVLWSFWWPLRSNLTSNLSSVI